MWFIIVCINNSYPSIYWLVYPIELETKGMTDIVRPTPRNLKCKSVKNDAFIKRERSNQFSIYM